MKKNFNKELVVIKEDNEDLKKSTNCWISSNDYVDNDVKQRNHCHVTGKYRWSAHRDWNINLKLNSKFLSYFNNLKNYDFQFIMKKLGEFNLKIIVIQMD